MHAENQRPQPAFIITLYSSVAIAVISGAAGPDALILELVMPNDPSARTCRLTIRTEVQGQPLVGEETYRDARLSAQEAQRHPQIPRSQRCATRPMLAALLPAGLVHDQKELARRLLQVVESYGYRQSELARHVEVHYSTISRWLHHYENSVILLEIPIIPDNHRTLLSSNEVRGRSGGI